MRNNRRNELSSAPTAPKQPRNDDPEGLGSFGKGLLDARGARDFWWNVFTGPISGGSTNGTGSVTIPPPPPSLAIKSDHLLALLARAMIGLSAGVGHY